jgi:hypothetical protein
MLLMLRLDALLSRHFCVILLQAVNNVLCKNLICMSIHFANIKYASHTPAWVNYHPQRIHVLTLLQFQVFMPMFRCTVIWNCMQLCCLNFAEQ